METGIAESFRDGTVLVTGSTGFLGKLLAEKLLRSCPVKSIVVLVRSKKGMTAEKRVADIYKQEIFNRLRIEKPDFMDRISVIEGNLEEPSLDLSPYDREWLIENVNFVFHCAATIKFNEPLEIATRINVQGTKNILDLATKMKNLKGFVHVSTAYSHCPRKEIKEEYYPVPVTAKDLENIDTLDKSTTEILENWPNTYTFTKAVAENLISTKYADILPISIFRPSIICCTISEPEPGWLENMNGPTGIASGFMVGFLRTVPNVGTNITDIIPADYTVNALISVMWDTVNRYQRRADAINEEPKIFNYISCVESPLTWRRYISEMHSHYYKAPPMQSMWYGYYIFYTNLWLGMILRFIFHRIPAAFMDLALVVGGKRPKMLRMYSKTESMIDLLYEFTMRQWKFDNSNTRELWSTLSKEDRDTFCYSLEHFDWKPYLKNYYYGIRKHILHEDPSNTDKALAKNRKLYWLHQLSIFLAVYLMLNLLWMFVKYFS